MISIPQEQHLGCRCVGRTISLSSVLLCIITRRLVVDEVVQHVDIVATNCTACAEARVPTGAHEIRRRRPRHSLRDIEIPCRSSVASHIGVFALLLFLHGSRPGRSSHASQLFVWKLLTPNSQGCKRKVKVRLTTTPSKAATNVEQTAKLTAARLCGSRA